MQLTNVIGTISLIGACALAVTTVRAVMPAPDGGYPGGNTAEGDDALFSLDTSQGLSNTAIGLDALFSLTTGSFNTAIGYTTLLSNTTGIENTAIGYEALTHNTGSGNTSVGSGASGQNTTGQFNTASGNNALYSNTTGSNNTAAGQNALVNNTTGSNNIALGNLAGSNLSTGSNNIDIGHTGVAAELNTIRVGVQNTQTATYIAGIFGAAIGAGPAVHVNGAGKLGTAPSSARFKEAIKPMDKASEIILALQPVTFRYKKEYDPDKAPQFGLVAEQVEKVDPDLVFRDNQGKPYTVRYEAVNAMLLNEFLKEHRKVEEQERAIGQLKSIVQKQQETIAQEQKDSKTTAGQQQKEIQALLGRLNAQESQIRKVSERVEMRKPASQMVAENQ